MQSSAFVIRFQSRLNKADLRAIARVVSEDQVQSPRPESGLQVRSLEAGRNRRRPSPDLDPHPPAGGMALVAA